MLRSQADHLHGYAEALADGVARPVVFLALSGQALAGQRRREVRGATGRALSAEGRDRCGRGAQLDPGQWMPAVIGGRSTLRQLRAHVPDAGGMIIASDRTTARAYARRSPR